MGTWLWLIDQKQKNDDDSMESLRQMSNKVSIQANLKSDMAVAFVRHKTDFQQIVQKLQIYMTHSEPYQHKQLQSVDVAIRELKRQW